MGSACSADLGVDLRLAGSSGNFPDHEEIHSRI